MTVNLEWPVPPDPDGGAEDVEPAESTAATSDVQELAALLA